MGKGEKDERYTEAETQRRFEVALRAALNTPPKPMKDVPKKRPAPKPQRSKQG